MLVFADCMQWVVIEFGHNDGGSLATDDGLTDCPGQGNEVCYSEYGGVNETIYTYPAYLEKAADLYLAKGAKVIIDTPTPDNPWESGTFTWTPNRFSYYPWYASLSPSNCVSLELTSPTA